MQNQNYFDVISRMPVGYACHRRLVGKDGDGSEYLIIEVNKEFEFMMGRCANELCGYETSKILIDENGHGINIRDLHYATHFYNREVEFSIFSKQKERWYEVKAYKIKDDYIVTILKDAREINTGSVHHCNENHCLSFNHILVDTIMNALFEKNPREMLHSQRVGHISKLIARDLKNYDLNIEEIEEAGALHDIGKIGVSNGILDKKEHLNKEEWLQIKSHSKKGFRILSGALSFSRIASIVYEHHERLDGSGYPRGLRNKEISLEAKIIAVADVFDAMISERPYKEEFSENFALEELNRYAGQHFDNDIVGVLTELVSNKIWTKKMLEAY